MEEHAPAAEASQAAEGPRAVGQPAVSQPAVSQPGLGALSGIRLGFLYNHDALHQVAHSAPIIGQLAELHPELEITILSSTEAQAALIRQQLPATIAGKIRFVELRLTGLLENLDRFARHVAPFRRVAILRSNLDVLRGFDALVVPEGTSAMLKTRFGLDQLKLIYTHHGAGDRSVGFSAEVAHFDLVLVPGPKIRDRLMSLGLIREGDYAMVGYPKFDAIGSSDAKRPPLFANDKPTVLYNPHSEPRLSSWYEMGIEVLDYFAATPAYNLVFAPHVMLFQRRIHTSLESFTLRFRRSLPERFRSCENIQIDLGSHRCIDMSYTLGADIYLGDVSSQVYEFLLHPRPCIFLNAHGAQWQDDPDYLHWNCGPVLQHVAALDGALARTAEDRGHYGPVQESLFAQTIEPSDTPSSRRAALAIAAFLAR